MSEISGTLEIAEGELERIAAGKIFKAAFLAPEILISPFNLLPPTIFIFDIIRLFDLKIAVSPSTYLTYCMAISPTIQYNKKK
jgi:hypothetical protein